MGDKTFPCPRCKRLFADRNAVWQHAKIKHGVRTKHECPGWEPTLAEIAVEASIKRNMGMRLDPLEESLLP